MRTVATLRWVTLLAALIPGCEEETQSPALAGHVLDGSGQAIPGARIGIVYQLSAPVSAAVTDPEPYPVPVTKLYAPAPNPFEHRTSIRFGLAANRRVELRVFSFHADPVVDLIHDRELPAGLHQVVWDGKDNSGRLLPNGAYLLRFSTAPVDSIVGERERWLFNNDADPAHFLEAFAAVTDADGRFRISLQQLPVHASIDATDVEGRDLGRCTVLSRIRVCAAWGPPEAVLTDCVDAELGRLDRTVSVELHLPVP